MEEILIDKSSGQPVTIIQQLDETQVLVKFDNGNFSVKRKDDLEQPMVISVEDADSLELFDSDLEENVIPIVDSENRPVKLQKINNNGTAIVTLDSRDVVVPQNELFLNINHLPADLIIRLLTQSDLWNVKSVSTLAKVAKAWNNIFTSDVVWRILLKKKFHPQFQHYQNENANDIVPIVKMAMDGITSDPQRRNQRYLKRFYEFLVKNKAGPPFDWYKNEPNQNIHDRFYIGDASKTFFITGAKGKTKYITFVWQCNTIFFVLFSDKYEDVGTKSGIYLVAFENLDTEDPFEKLKQTPNKKNLLPKGSKVRFLQHDQRGFLLTDMISLENLYYDVLTQNRQFQVFDGKAVLMTPQSLAVVTPGKWGTTFIDRDDFSKKKEFGTVFAIESRGRNSFLCLSMYNMRTYMTKGRRWSEYDGPAGSSDIPYESFHLSELSWVYPSDTLLDLGTPLDQNGQPLTKDVEAVSYRPERTYSSKMVDVVYDEKLALEISERIQGILYHTVNKRDVRIRDLTQKEMNDWVTFATVARYSGSVYRENKGSGNYPKFPIFHYNQSLGRVVPHLYYPSKQGGIWVRFRYNVNNDANLLVSSCITCGSIAKVMCSLCEDASYCSKKCQEKDWKTTHANECPRKK